MYIHILFIYICINPNMIMLKFQGSTEKEVHFPGLIKGCNTILQNYREKSFILFRIYKSKSGITRGDQEKIMSNFHESWFLTLKFPRRVTQFYRISKGKKRFILSRFSKGRVTNLKDPGSFLKKVCPQSPFGFFWNSPTIISYVLVSLVIVRILTER